MPTRSSDRGLDPTEGFGANHFSHVRIRTLRLLEPGFHHPHLVDVLDQTFRAGIAADDAFPARLYGNLAPWPSLRFGQLHVDESALAIAAAPAADRVVVGRAAIGKRFDGVELSFESMAFVKKIAVCRVRRIPKMEALQLGVQLPKIQRYPRSDNLPSQISNQPLVDRFINDNYASGRVAIRRARKY